MRTSGGGSDGPFILMGVVVLMLAGILASGGPYNFFQAANKILLNLAERVVLWVQTHS